MFVFSWYCILWESQPYYIDYINCYCGCIPIGLHFQSLKHSHLLLIVFQLSGILFEWILPSMSFSSKYFTVIRSHSIDGDWLVKCPQNRTIFFSHFQCLYRIGNVIYSSNNRIQTFICPKIIFYSNNKHFDLLFSHTCIISSVEHGLLKLSCWFVPVIPKMFHIMH